jgi:hypothetical protein
MLDPSRAERAGASARLFDYVVHERPERHQIAHARAAGQRDQSLEYRDIYQEIPLLHEFVTDRSHHFAVPDDHRAFRTQPVQVVRPPLHHLLATRKEGGAIICSPIGVLDCMGELMLDPLNPIA